MEELLLILGAIILNIVMLAGAVWIVVTVLRAMGVIA